MDRETHAGKSKSEKASYKRALKSPLPPQPTIDEDIIDQTNKEDDNLFNGQHDPEPLKDYNPPKIIPYKEILIGLLLAVITGLISILIINLNRDVGTLFERVDNSISSNKDQHEQINKNINDVESKLDSVDDKIKDIQIDVRVLQMTQK